jgi:hypothetical protein
MSQQNTTVKSETPATPSVSSGSDSGTAPESGKKSTFVDTLFDIGLSWADFGVGQGKRALEQSAKTLEKVASSLNDLQQKLRKDHAS